MKRFSGKVWAGDDLLGTAVEGEVDLVTDATSGIVRYEGRLAITGTAPHGVRPGDTVRLDCDFGLSVDVLLDGERRGPDPEPIPAECPIGFRSFRPPHADPWPWDAPADEATGSWRDRPPLL